jgi:hypothetical protein
MEFFSNSNSHEARSSTPRSGGFQTAEQNALQRVARYRRKLLDTVA